MRYRDQPTVEVVRRLSCAPETAWDYVTDISLPTHVSAELQSAEWLDGAEGVAVGARFKGHNRNDFLGDWATVCEVVEVEPGRRWVWNVLTPGGVGATWAFEVEPASEGSIVRQWARLGPDQSGLSMAIAAQPDKEARIIERRMGQWRSSMEANLAYIAQQTGSDQ